MYAFAHHKPVYHDFNVMLFVLFQRDRFGKVIEYPVHADTDIAAFFCILQQLDVFTLAPAHDRCKQLQLCAFRQFHDAVYNLVYGLPADFLAAFRAVRDTDTGKQQTQVIVNFRYRADCGTRVMAGCFLVNGNCRGKPLDEVNVWLFHLPQKLSCIGGQGFHIPPLALRVNRIESKGAFT